MVCFGLKQGQDLDNRAAHPEEYPQEEDSQSCADGINKSSFCQLYHPAPVRIFSFINYMILL